MVGRDDPTAASLARLELKAAREALGARQSQARAIRLNGDVTPLDSPATGASLTALIKARRKHKLGARNEALLRVAYDTAFPRSELVAINVAHIDARTGRRLRRFSFPRA